MASPRTTVLDDEGRIARIPEGTTPIIEALIHDGSAGIPAASLATLTLTLYVAGDPTAILNGRDAQNVLNQNGVTVDSGGNLAWTMSALDNAVLGSDPEEQHIALFEWTWGANRVGRHELLLTVANLGSVP